MYLAIDYVMLLIKLIILELPWKLLIDTWQLDRVWNSLFVAFLWNNFQLCVLLWFVVMFLSLVFLISTWFGTVTFSCFFIDLFSLDINCAFNDVLSPKLCKKSQLKTSCQKVHDACDCSSCVVVIATPNIAIAVPPSWLSHLCITHLYECS